jgi:hypothetical protein
MPWLSMTASPPCRSATTCTAQHNNQHHFSTGNKQQHTKTVLQARSQSLAINAQATLKQYNVTSGSTNINLKIIDTFTFLIIA